MTVPFNVDLALAYTCMLALFGWLFTALLPLSARALYRSGSIYFAERLRGHLAHVIASNELPTYLPEVRVGPLFPTGSEPASANSASANSAL